MKYSAIRTEIKKLSDEQRNLKPQRKTIYFEGTRTHEPGIACDKVQDNRYVLRHLFAAYAVIKGMERPEIKNPMKIINDRMIENFIAIYTPPKVEDTAA
jgi:hypothetical protein